MKTQRTPTPPSHNLPWTFEDCGKDRGIIAVDRFEIQADSNIPGIKATVARVQYKPHAAFIVRAVNAHELMYKALQSCLNSEYVDQYGTHIPVIKGELRQQIAQAIARAEGK